MHYGSLSSLQKFSKDLHYFLRVNMNRNSYHPFQVWIHWIVFLLVVASIASVQLHELMPKGSEIRATFVRIHMLMGQLIFISVVIRVLARFLIKGPEPVQMPQWQTG